MDVIKINLINNTGNFITGTIQQKKTGAKSSRKLLLNIKLFFFKLRNTTRRPRVTPVVAFPGPKTLTQVVIESAAIAIKRTAPYAARVAETIVRARTGTIEFAAHRRAIT